MATSMFASTTSTASLSAPSRRLSSSGAFSEDNPHCIARDGRGSPAAVRPPPPRGASCAGSCCAPSSPRPSRHSCPARSGACTPRPRSSSRVGAHDVAHPLREGGLRLREPRFRAGGGGPRFRAGGGGAERF
eukprot:6017404-Prymnesium_polylepis.1